LVRFEQTLLKLSNTVPVAAIDVIKDHTAVAVPVQCRCRGYHNLWLIQFIVKIVDNSTSLSNTISV